MSLSGMVEIPRPFGFAQDMLSREKRKRESRLRLDAVRTPWLIAEGCLIAGQRFQLIEGDAQNSRIAAFAARLRRLGEVIKELHGIAAGAN